MDRHVPWHPGTVVHIDREKYEGLVRLDEDTDKEDLQFDRSKLALDDRYIDDVIVGAQFFCQIHVDDTGARRVESMYPRDTMYFNGVITEIRRLEGVAYVAPETLETSVAFSRTHLDRPDDFRKLRTGDKVQIEMNFYNLISKRKPPRATRVHLSECLIEPEARLRPALRRSRSSSRQNPSVDSELFDDYGTRQGFSSQSRSFDEDIWAMTSARRGFEMFGPEPGAGAPLSYNRPAHPMLMPPNARPYPMQAHSQFTPLSSSAAWMPRPYGSHMHGSMPLPVHRIPYGQPYQGPLPFYSAGSYPGRSPWLPPASYQEEFERQERDHRTRELLMSVLNRPPSPRNRHVDDSDVVIEMTVEELRRLMLERPASRS